jgi:predicted metal-dependent hydrolase
MNHSRSFWGRVGRVLPDYAKRRKWLRENEHLLTL